MEENGFCEIRCEDLREFENEVDKLRSKHRRNRLLFRGQGDSSWPLKSSLERQVGDKFSDFTLSKFYSALSRCRGEVETFTNRKWDFPEADRILEICSGYDTLDIELWKNRKLPGHQLMTYLRHHGFASPLLDWSLSPYVAIFFAFRERRDCESRAIYMLTEMEDQLYSSNMSIIRDLDPYGVSSDRHLAQQSSYTICLKHKDAQWLFHPHDSESLNRSYSIYKLIIHNNERLRIIGRLFQANVNPYTLLGHADGLAEFLSMKEELRSEGILTL